MIQAYIKMWKNAFNFSGRTSRADYWWTYLANFLAAIVIGVLAGILSVVLSLISSDLVIVGEIISMILGIGYSLAMLIPSISLCIRRLHDIGKSGWIYLLCCITSGCCGLGSIAFIVLTCMDSQPGTNQYGPNPKGVDNTYNQSYNNMNASNQNYGFNQDNTNQF